jgi:hypothetical protein
LGILFSLSAHSPVRDSLGGLDLGPFLEVLAPELTEPAAKVEAFLAVGVLDEPVEGHVRGDDDLSHCCSLSIGVVTVGDADTATPRNWAAWDRPVRALAGVYRSDGSAREFEKERRR